MSLLPERAERVLEGGTFCFAAADTPRGPHLTPLVFALSGGHVWLTTSRGSVKARAWAREPRVAGLVQHGVDGVAFAGRVRTYDVLDAGTWAPSILGAPALAAAGARFTRKNARFFAGYAVDARQVPLAWTPPGRVFARIELERGALLHGGSVLETWGPWPGTSGSAQRFRRSARGPDPLEGLPAGVAERIGRSGWGAAIAVEGDAGTAVLPAGWVATDHELFAALPRAWFDLAGAGTGERVALALNRASWWRASDMAGAMVQGDASLSAVEQLSSGAASAAELARTAGVGDPERAVVARIAPRRLVWWLGWSSGAVERT
jgi:pyridoxamine 5'-phosphate oxidase-like protein